MAHDFDRNRAVALKNAGTAEGFMKDYNAGDIGSAGAAAPAYAKTTTSTPNAAPAVIEAVSFARQAAASRTAVDQIAGRAINITGNASQEPQGNRVYLNGAGLYPYVILNFNGAAPA